MRKIKFRGWVPHPSDATKSKWVYGFLHIEKVNNRKCWIKDGVFNWRVTPESIGEFTGLADKNLKEIYSGDIDSKGRIVEYVINMSGFYLMKNGEGSHLCHSQNVLNGCIKHLEIVGNDYEDPNLLK